VGRPPRRVSAVAFGLRWPRFRLPTTCGSSEPRLVRRPGSGERAVTSGPATGWALVFRIAREK